MNGLQRFRIELFWKNVLVMKRVISFWSCFVITIFLVIWAGNFLEGNLNMGSMGAVEAFHTLPVNSVDVIGFGSSHMWAAFDSTLLYEEYGLAAYNYANNWQKMDTTLLFLKDALKTQQPKVAVIETYMVGSHPNDELNGEVYYTRAIKWSKDKANYLCKRFGKKLNNYIGYFIPIAAFHDNWANINADFWMDNSSKRMYLRTLGQSKVDFNVPISIPDYQSFQQEELDEESLALLDEIVSICKENDIKVIFITTPMDEKYSYFDAMEEYAQKHEVTYINYFSLMNEIGIDCNADFYDGSHLNVQGAYKVSHHLGNYLKNNYNIEDAHNSKFSEFFIGIRSER